jgi:hypothetical protein
VRVTGYRVERCRGAGCTNFRQLGQPASNGFHPTALTPSTIYRFRVRATDGAGNLSTYSNLAKRATLRRA